MCKAHRQQIWLAADSCRSPEKSLDKIRFVLYYIKVAIRDAAIAQSVERILGKDEVASSNLASSSNETPILM